MARLTWDERFDTGVPLIDEQHRGLLDLINELDDKLVHLSRFLSGRREMLEIIGRLAEYADVHFEDEEGIMARCGYPKLEEHRREHDRFRDLIRRLESQYAEGDTQVPEAALDFLTAWLVDHIRTEDQQVAAYYRK